MGKSERYNRADLNDIKPVECPCGQTRRAFADDPDKIASVHRVNISVDSLTHYHKKLAEIYYILEGEGFVELDGQMLPVSSGYTVMIKPGCRHRAVGRLRVLNVSIPAFDEKDEYFD